MLLQSWWTACTGGAWSEWWYYVNISSKSCFRIRDKLILESISFKTTILILGRARHDMLRYDVCGWPEINNDSVTFWQTIRISFTHDCCWDSANFASTVCCDPLATTQVTYFLLDIPMRNTLAARGFWLHQRHLDDCWVPVFTNGTACWNVPGSHAGT